MGKDIAVIGPAAPTVNQRSEAAAGNLGRIGSLSVRSTDNESGVMRVVHRLGNAIDTMPFGQRAALLLVLGLLSLGSYFWYVHMYPLVSLERIRYGFADLDPNHVRVVEVPALWCVLFLAYLLAYRVMPLRPSRSLVVLVAVMGLAFAVVLVFMYPIASNDLYDYIVHARLATQHQANPYTSNPSVFPRDEFYQVAYWKGNSTSYGPSWQLLADAITGWAGNSYTVTVFAFKLVGLAFYGGAVALVGLLLRRLYPANLGRGLVLFAWNPLLIFEWVGNGHNDAVLVFWLLVAMYFFVTRWDTLAWLALAAATLVKFTPAIVLPLFIAILLLSSQWRRATTWLAVALRLLVVCAFVLILYLPFGLSSLGSNLQNLQGRSQMFIHSLPSLAYFIVVAAGMASNRAAKYITLACMAILVCVVIWQVVRLIRTPAHGRRALLRPFAAAGFEVFFFLMLLTLWFWPWYVTWLFAFVPFLRQARRIERAVLFSFSVFGIHWVDFLSLNQHPLRESLVAFFIGVAPVILFSVGLWTWSMLRARGTWSPAPRPAVT